MLRLDLSLNDAADNLALDEALLLSAEQGGDEVLRFWRFSAPVVVLGRGSKIREEVDINFCENNSVEILRRASGGASIVAGADCLMYSVVLDLVLRPNLRDVDQAHRFVIGNLAAAVERQRPDIRWQGICDLTVDAKKFSGNSLRVARNHLLYHGTILQKVSPQFIARCLKTAPRQPEYRAGRNHDEFVTAIDIDAGKLCDDLANLYGVSQKMRHWPESETKRLASEKYRCREWTWRH
jgi:lipoate-protein ligase A